MRSLLLTCLIALLAVACRDATPTAPDEVSVPLFKPKCDTPPCKDDGGEDPPPPPPPSNVEPHILFSSALEANAGGGGCKRGDLSWSVYRMDLNGAFERVFGDDLESQSGSLYPSFSPDGQSFAFYRDIYTVAKGRCATEHFQIATSNLDGTGFTIIHEVERGFGGLDQPRWSPGPVGGVERIGWLEWTGVYSLNVVIARPDGTGQSSVVQNVGDYEIEGFEWSRTGDAILVNFRDWGNDHSFLRLYSLDCSGSCATSGFVDVGDLSPIPLNNWFAEMDWARQGDRIAVPACGGGTCELWMVDLADPVNPAVTQLTANGLDEQEVSWSPDDSRLLFTAWPVGGTRMAIEMDLTAAVLPWNGDLSAAGIRVLADVGNSWGTDWRSY